MGRCPELTGGGLIRSAGGWAAFKSLGKSKAHLKGDERILGDSDFVELLQQLESPASTLGQQWDAEHDRYVAHRLLARIEPLFEPASLAAFRRVVIDGQKPRDVAAELGLSVNAVLVAKSRVLRQLRRELKGLTDLSD